MANPTFSSAAIIIRGMEKHSISGNFLGAVAGVNPSLLSQYLNGKKNLSDSLAQHLLRTLETIDELAKRCHPVPVTFHPLLADKFKVILKDFEKRKLLVSVVYVGGTETPEDIVRAALSLSEALSVLAGENPEAPIEPLSEQKMENVNVP